jgi:SAM-dependent methyltransferase
MILPGHAAYYLEIFSLPGFLADPLLVFGVQDILTPTRSRRAAREFLPFDDLGGYLRSRGLGQVVTMDCFDPRADLHYDFNQPVPEHEHGRYATLIDIGCLEHVFDSRQCLENCLRLVRHDGHFLLHTPVKGYYGHGLHTFDPEGLRGALELNGFQVVYLKYSTKSGRDVSSPGAFDDVLIWIVGKKVAEFDRFTSPQQARWTGGYPTSRVPGSYAKRAGVALRRWLGR